MYHMQKIQKLYNKQSYKLDKDFFFFPKKEC